MDGRETDSDILPNCLLCSSHICGQQACWVLWHHSYLVYGRPEVKLVTCSRSSTVVTS